MIVTILRCSSVLIRRTGMSADSWRLLTTQAIGSFLILAKILAKAAALVGEEAMGFFITNDPLWKV